MNTKKSQRKKLQDSMHSLLGGKESRILSMKSALDNHILMKESWLKRLYAIAVDYFILFLATAIISPAAHLTELILIMGTLSLAYFTVTESCLGYTLGKKIFGIKVTHINGTKPSLKKIFARNITKFNAVLLLADTIIGYYTSNTHQKYSDNYVNTIVVNSSLPKVTFHETTWHEATC